ncbi:MAG TPA: tRNA pseudouridine(55) synthase TruB, partial [Candidatus Nanopelagicales bacterium]|nr:tRNA pseudouridine(55) synthase TruB [Candidatus Nanopelagicales bacterium]
MARGPRERTAPDSLVVVDKPAGVTSHDVVARVRRLAGTRKVGHAGTLDPMATGVLLVGVERTTRLLGHLALTDKAYSATVRLGVTTVTDDAEGETVSVVDASGVPLDQVETALVALRGDIQQRPSAVSAIKVDGVRSYKRVRDGEDVELPARPVTVSRLEVVEVRRDEGVLDLDVEVECSTGTYVRALSRDLGAALGVGGHLTALRRTRVGAFGLDRARTLDELTESFDAVPLVDVVRDSFGVVEVDASDVDPVLHGGRVESAYAGPSPVGVVDPDGRILSLA